MKNRKFKKVIFSILILIVVIWSFIGISWGIPSIKLKNLYFYDKNHIDLNINLIKTYSVDESWKGWGAHLVLFPEEAEKKLPRNLYNPIRSYHPDEYAIIKSLSYMKPYKFDFNPHQFAMGGAYLYLVGFLIYFLSKIKVIKLTKDLDFYFYNPEEIGKFYILGRLLTAFYGIGIIILSYLMAKKIYKNQKKAVLISFLILFTPLIILNSLYMYVDIPGLFWIMMCLYFSLKIIENPNNKNSFLTGIFSGLACGTKINLFVSIFIPLIATILIYKNIKKIILSLIYIVGGFILSFGFTNPYFFITWPLPLIELKQHAPLSFSGKFYLNALGYGIGWPIFIICLVGIFLNRKNFTIKERTLIFLWIMFFFLFISLFSKNYARYILPIVPSFIILGGEFWIQKGKNKFLNNFKKILLYFCLVFSFIYGVSFKGLFVKENIRTEASIWIKKNIGKGKSIGVCEIPWQFQMPPFDYFYYKVTVINYDFEKLKKELPDYFIISSFQGQIPPYPSNLQKERIDFWQKFINSNLYSQIKSFQNFPSFGIIKFKFKVLPEDLIYINPTILIFKKNE